MRPIVDQLITAIRASLQKMMDTNKTLISEEQLAEILEKEIGFENLDAQFKYQKN